MEKKNLKGLPFSKQTPYVSRVTEFSARLRLALRLPPRPVGTSPESRATRRRRVRAPELRWASCHHLLRSGGPSKPHRFVVQCGSKRARTPTTSPASAIQRLDGRHPLVRRRPHRGSCAQLARRPWRGVGVSAHSQRAMLLAIARER